MRIAKGCSVHFETSICPLPLINIGALDRDFFDGIVGKLKWCVVVCRVLMLMLLARSGGCGSGSCYLVSQPSHEQPTCLWCVSAGCTYTTVPRLCMRAGIKAYVGRQAQVSSRGHQVAAVHAHQT